MMKFISSLSPSKLKGQIKTFLDVYPLIEVFDLHTQSLPNIFSGVMHNLDLVWWEKNLIQFGHAS